MRILERFAAGEPVAVSTLLADLLIVARSLLTSILQTTQEQLALTSRLPVIEVITRHDTD